MVGDAAHDRLDLGVVGAPQPGPEHGGDLVPLDVVDAADRELGALEGDQAAVAAVAAPHAARGREEVEVGGYRIPKGAQILASPWVVQRDARWFPDPERFDPDRWEGARGKEIPRFAYFPFGGGPRVCIGQHFAMLEMTLVAALLLQHCTLHRVPGEPEPRPRMYVTLRPDRPLRLQLRRRAKAAAVRGA